MVENRQPIAVRVVRPHDSVDDFLSAEIDTVTRTSVLLIGAASRPQGVVLRFEVTLRNGEPLLRGEGRVVGYREKAFGDEPGLTLRFTRLDPKSKALVDRAALLRDATRAPAGSAPRTLPGHGVPVPPAPPSAPRPLESRTSEVSAPDVSDSSIVVDDPSSAKLPDAAGPASTPEFATSPEPVTATSPLSTTQLTHGLDLPPPSARTLTHGSGEFGHLVPPPPDSSTSRLAPPPQRAKPPATLITNSPVRPPPSARHLRSTIEASPAPPAPFERPHMPPPIEPPPVAPESAARMTASATNAESGDLPRLAPNDRDALLARLRDRARALPADRTEAILKKK